MNPSNGGNAPVDQQGRYNGPPMGQNQQQRSNNGYNQNQSNPPPNAQNNNSSGGTQGNQAGRKRPWQ